MATLACDRTSSKYLNSLHPNLADTQRMPASHARFQEGRIHMHMSISAPGDIPQSDQQAKGQNSNLLLQPVCKFRGISDCNPLEKLILHPDNQNLPY
jgi:hypothetical protein